MLDRDLLLPHLIRRRASEQLDRTYLTDVNGRSLTYGEFHQRGLIWAEAFRRIGVDAGETVLTMLPLSFESYESWLGLAWLKAIEVPLNTAYKGRMLQYVATNSQAKAMIISARFVDELAKVADQIPNLEMVVVLGSSGPTPSLPCHVIPADEFFDGCEVAEPQEGPDYWDISCIIYTSGTTGPSKGVLVPWAELYQFTQGAAEGTATENDIYYNFYPAFHVSGKVGIYGSANHNSRTVLREVFSLENFWPDIRKFKCTTTTLVGPLAQLLLLQPHSPEDADSSLRMVGMAPLIPELDEFKRRFNLTVTVGYGMSEIGMVFVSDTDNLPNTRTVGKPKPGYELRVVDAHDEPLNANEIGELVVRADDAWVLNAGYFGMPEKTAEAWRNGWFHTGDAFMYDEDGYWYFVDRVKDAIRRRGENISSFEVEAYVGDHPDVQECAAIAAPSEFTEDDVKIVVVRRPDSNLTPEGLIEFLVPRMPRFMIPRYIEFTESLPRTEATQRVQKAKLREDPINENTWDREKAGVKLPH